MLGISETRHLQDPFQAHPHKAYLHIIAFLSLFVSRSVVNSDVNARLLSHGGFKLRTNQQGMHIYAHTKRLNQPISFM